MNGISGEAPKGGGGCGIVVAIMEVGISGASSFLRRPYRADWDWSRPGKTGRWLYGFARRAVSAAPIYGRKSNQPAAECDCEVCR